MATFDDGAVSLHKDLGLVAQVLRREITATLPGRAGIAHVRYPTVGGGARQDAQPFTTRRPSMALAHNGNLTNLAELDQGLRDRGIRLTSQCDAEPILCVLADEVMMRAVVRPTTEDVVESVRAVLGRVRGAYSVVAVMEVDGQETLVAFRDSHGIRPCCYGQRADGAWMAASESVALDVMDVPLTGHVPPGHVVLMRAGEEAVVRSVAPAEPRHCIFEDIYFARPDSRMEPGRVLDVRARLGVRLAAVWKRSGRAVDVVVAVPDTSRPAADAMARELGVRSEEGFIKNRYTGRTFIMPDQATREAALRLKLNPIDEVFRGRDVVLVDDSIVRGTTMRRIAGMVRRHEPKSLHVAIYSPPVRHPCFYGIDMPSADELVAGRLPVADLETRLASQLGADSVTFLTGEDLTEVAGKGLCSACFDGRYAVSLTVEERNWILSDRRPETTRAPAPPG